MRFKALLLAAFFSLTAAGFAEGTAVNFGTGAAVVDERGGDILPAGLYEKLFVLSRDDGTTSGYAAGVEGGYVLLDSSGERVSDAVCTEIRAAGGGFIVRRGYEYRYVTPEGALMDTGYGSMTYTGDANCLALTGNVYDEISDALSVILPDGSAADTSLRSVYALGEFSEGLLPLCDAETNMYGYVDANGAWAITPGYDYAGDFVSGLAIVSKGGRFGAIRKGGEIAVPTAYDLLLRTNEIFAGLTGGKAHIWDANLNQTGAIETGGASAALTGAFVILSDGESTRVYDSAGELKFSLEFGAEAAWAAGVFMLRDGPWSAESAYLADDNGNSISEKYNSIKYLGDGVFAYGIIEREGENMRFGLLSASGAAITEAIYDSITFVSEGVLCATTGVSALILDTGGAVLNTLM